MSSLVRRFRAEKECRSSPSVPGLRPRAERAVGRGRLLHGELQLEVDEARGLPPTDWILARAARRCLGYRRSLNDPYVAVYLDGTRLVTTSVMYNCVYWRESFRVPLCHRGERISLRIRDQHELSSNHLGRVEFAVEELLQAEGGTVEGWRDIRSARTGKKKGELHLKMIYRPLCAAAAAAAAAVEAEEEDGGDGGKDQCECEGCYFLMTKGNHVTLYSCARNVDEPLALPLSSSPSGPTCEYRPPSLWIDLFRSIVASRRFIYITGWSVYTDLKLLRGNDHKRLESDEEKLLSDLCLGELLKRKADEGVRVLLLIWDEYRGVMGTHDTRTEEFFRGSRVFVGSGSRWRMNREWTDWKRHVLVRYIFTHHQKAVVMDGTPSAKEEKGKTIVAYLGGLDLTDGRYDTPQHPLFVSPVSGPYASDFYNPCEPWLSSHHGPRLPWHDIHARVEGPAARDVMVNFIERWGKELPYNTRLLEQKVGSPFYNLNPLDNGGADELWNVQVFRSISVESARFRLEHEKAVTPRKGRAVDVSIERCYVQAIRRARRFIYVENQFFMGSAYAWLRDSSVKCHNVVPMEIAQKICQNIKDGTPFLVYVLLPMHSEGSPSDHNVQEILFWQRRTIEMMYTMVAQAILDRSKAEKTFPRYNPRPTDYLMFFCLGKKEEKEDISKDLAEPSRCSRASTLRRRRRYMVYVHSKLMVVDDAYAIVGSANLNQRSLDGDRDSELVIGAHQPGCALRGGQDEESTLPRGEVFKFRMSLFREHLGFVDPAFTDPSSERCMKMVKRATKRNWEAYMDDDRQMEGQLLPYPILVEASDVEGTAVVVLKPATKNKLFPDAKWCGAKILGRPKWFPNKFTT